MTVKYIILHWTGGNYKPSEYDKQHYQLLIDDEGRQYVGQPIGKVASTGGMNSITYNISCCGGLDRTPLTKKQCEALFKIVAMRLKEYKLTIDKVFTHAEIGQMVKDKTITKLLPYNNYLPQNIGKVDLTKLPYELNGKSHGDFIRNKIKWYLQKL